MHDWSGLGGVDMGAERRKKTKDAQQRSPGENGMERRALTTELRVADGDGDDEPTKITGYAAVFNQWSELLRDWWFEFKEMIMPGAFEQTIQEDDIRALWNHNPDCVLGRNRANTLALKEDDHGLWIEIIPSGARWVQDLIESIRRGDVSQMSFGFQVMSDRWGTEDEMDVRELHKVRLFDVSPVTFPAYPQTSVQARDQRQSLLESAGIEWDHLAGIIARHQRGLPTRDQDRELIDATVALLQGYLPQQSDSGQRNRTESQGQSKSRSLAILRNKLGLHEKTAM